MRVDKEGERLNVFAVFVLIGGGEGQDEFEHAGGGRDEFAFDHGAGGAGAGDGGYGTAFAHPGRFALLFFGLGFDAAEVVFLGLGYVLGEVDGGLRVGVGAEAFSVGWVFSFFY